MTDMLQKSENVAKNVANKNSQDLTSQWKKGELPEGDYFISYEDEIYPDYYDRAEGFLKTYDYGVRRVLAPVPSYEEWQAKLEENAQIKELLKECFEYIDWTDGTGSPISQQKLLDKIDEALR